MKVPTVTQRRFRDLGPPPPPFQGSGKSRRPRATSGYRPSVKLLTGPLPTDEGSGLKPLVTREGGRSEVVSKSRRADWIVGTVLGGLAMLCVVNFWMAVTLGVINDALGMQIPFWTHYSFPLALYGCHLLGVPGASLAKDGFQLGVVAIVAFWGSLLAGIPIGVLIRLLGG